MSLREGVNDAGEAITAMLAFFFVIVVFVVVTDVFDSNRMIPQAIKDTSSTLARQFLGLIIVTIAVVSALSGLVTLLKATDNPWWGLGYFIGLISIGLISLASVIYIVMQISSYMNVSLPKGVFSIIDVTPEAKLALTGVILGLALLLVIIAYELKVHFYQ